MGLLKKGWRRPTLPPPRSGSTIGAAGLNGRVRNGNGCGHLGMVTGKKHGRSLFSARRVCRGGVTPPRGILRALNEETGLYIKKAADRVASLYALLVIRAGIRTPTNRCAHRGA